MQRFSGPTWATKYKSVDARVLAELEGQAILFGLWLFGKSPCQVWGQRRGPGSVSPEHQEPPGLLALFLPLHGRQGSPRGKFALLKHVASSSLCALRTRRRDLLWWTFSTLTAYLWVTRFPYETPIQVGREGHRWPEFRVDFSSSRVGFSWGELEAALDSAGTLAVGVRALQLFLEAWNGCWVLFDYLRLPSCYWKGWLPCIHFIASLSRQEDTNNFLKYSFTPLTLRVFSDNHY